MLAGVLVPNSVAVGVMAHNEAATIRKCLEAILSEPDGDVRFTSVIVVASGCTDGTEAVVREIADRDLRVRLLSEDRRRGKATAINWFLAETEEALCIIVSGDVIPAPWALTRLVMPLLDPAVGMTGGRPVPTNRRVGLVGTSVHLLWELHHTVALTAPKLGEAIAFRRLFQDIDTSSLVDEASIESQVIDAGRELRYVPDAIFRNHGPETVSDYLAQRSRIHLGHLRLLEATGRAPSTFGAMNLLGVVTRAAARRPRRAHWLAAAIGLEVVARGRASLAFRFGRRREAGLWRPIRTSKEVVRPGQSLRTHSDDQVEIRLTPGGEGPGVLWSLRSRRVQVLQALREEDSVRVDGDALRIHLYANREGAALAVKRLATLLPGWTVSIPAGVERRIADLEPVQAPALMDGESA